jgi:peptidoglycan hydrolase CwlO-like protein
VREAPHLSRTTTLPSSFLTTVIQVLAATVQTFQSQVKDVQHQHSQQPSELQRIVAEVASLRSEMERVHQAAAAAAAPQATPVVDPASSIREITHAFTMSLREIIASVRAPASHSAGG